MTKQDDAFFITHPSCIEHKTGEGHPESHYRLEAMLPVLRRLLPEIEAPLAKSEQLKLAHHDSHIKHILNAIPSSGSAHLDADTAVSPQSGEAALHAAGAAFHAVDLIMDGSAKFIFNAVRPPGHHAEKASPGGFCLFNNVALASLYALRSKGLERIAIIDYDVHHGNGTQDIIWNEKKCFFASTHQSPLYPYTGSADEKGAHNNILNVPLPGGSDGSLMREIYTQTVFPAVRDFAPQFIFVSAGFDAHRADPLATLNWSTSDFGWLGEQIKDLADELCKGKVMATLEGGYDLDALAASTQAFIKPFLNEET